MAHWAVVLSADTYEAERLFANEGVKLPYLAGPAAGDAVLLVAGDEPVLFGLGRVSRSGDAVEYTHRFLDEPISVEGVPFDEPGLYPLDAAAYDAWAGKVGADKRVDASRRTWLVSVDLPIEAASPAEAVRSFWSYVYELGPRELPAFVAPSDDELAMQAYVLGVETNLDPEEEE